MTGRERFERGGNKSTVGHEKGEGWNLTQAGVDCKVGEYQREKSAGKGPE